MTCNHLFSLTFGLSENWDLFGFLCLGDRKTLPEGMFRVSEHYITVSSDYAILYQRTLHICVMKVQKATQVFISGCSVCSIQYLHELAINVMSFIQFFALLFMTFDVTAFTMMEFSYLLHWLMHILTCLLVQLISSRKKTTEVLMNIMSSMIVHELLSQCTHISYDTYWEMSHDLSLKDVSVLTYWQILNLFQVSLNLWFSFKGNTALSTWSFVRVLLL